MNFFYYILFFLFTSNLTLFAETREDQYLVFLKGQATPHKNTEEHTENLMLLEEVKERMEAKGVTILGSYSSVVLAYLAQIPSQTLDLVKEDPLVEKILPDTLMHTADSLLWTRSWGMDRLDQRDLPLDNSYHFNHAGYGSHIYIVDSGIRASHNEFTRANKIGDGFNAVDDSSPFEDCIGHGTHVSAIAAGKTAGPAKAATLHPVKVFGCSGSTASSVILKGLEWVIENHSLPAVVNMSLGGPGVGFFDTAIANLNKAGITVVVAAGNSNRDACSTSPAHSPQAITVAASAIDDTLASFSNWGPCVDIIAPGVLINSAWYHADLSYEEKSGTSMSAPFVTGAVALAQSAYRFKKETEIKDEVLRNASEGKILDPKGSPNKLLNTQDIGKDPHVFIEEDYIVVKYPKKNFTVLGTALDPDGKILEASWKQLMGPEISSFHRWKQQLTLNNLLLGTYKFRYEATDDEGRSSHDDVLLIVADGNIAPIANAGEDLIRKRSYDSIFLDGRESFDYDGSIASSLWKQISGPSLSTIKYPENLRTRLDDLEPGDYEFQLTVTDDSGDSTTDTVKVHVNAHPVANAGEDQVLQYEDGLSTTVTGTAVDSDGSIALVTWGKKSGPNGSVITNPNSLTTEITHLKVGEYVFTLKAMDDKGAQNQDKMTITVLSAP